MKYNLLLPLLLAGTAAGAAELLPNGTFEQKFKGWHYADYAGKPEPGAVVSDIVYGGNSRDVEMTLVDGRVVYERGTPIAEDLDAVCARIQDLWENWFNA